MVPFDNRKAFITALNKSGKGSIYLYGKAYRDFILLQLAPYRALDKYLPVRHPPASEES